MSRRGVFPLSPTLDSVGSLGASVECCARLDSVMTGSRVEPLASAPLADLRFALPTTPYIADGMDTTVSEAFDSAVGQLRDSGVSITQTPFDIFERLPQELERGGGFTAAESFHIHRRWIDTWSDVYDPRVLMRIRNGQYMSAADYLDLQWCRRDRMAEIDSLMMEYDALIMPTVSIVPPQFSDVVSENAYLTMNALVLKNTTIANLSGCVL